jgi:N-methylhydantoinase A
MTVRIGVDVGGTFTDLVLANSDGDKLHTGKLLTTPDDPGRAIIEGIERLLDEASVSAADVSGLIHGTTLVTNTVIERTGARVGLITTSGFRDVVEIGREIRYDLYDLFLEPPPTLVPRERRLEVDGRIDATGAVLAPLDPDQVRQVARTLSDQFDVQAIAIGLMHAYANPAHEQAVALIVAEECPGIPLTLSSAIAPEIREFERISTACANAYVQPLMRGYLTALEQQLKTLGIRAPLFVMLSGGGIATVAQSVQHPIRLIESGPAAGAMAACHYGRQLGEPDLISFDMGGTTAKICLIENGKPQRTHDFEAGRVRRFKKGSGIPLKVTVVDMIEIGAGGGSLALVDSMGLMKVGPRSAGSVPGPICYARGGTEPAVTDADLLLGFLDPDYFLGGELNLDISAVSSQIINQLAEPLGMELDRTVTGVYEVVNENMAAATRRYLAEKGRDPRRYSMIAFGGAGPVHAYGLAKKLKLTKVIVPMGAGVTSALGFLVAPPAVDDVRSHVSRIDQFDVEAVNALFEDMERTARAHLLEAGAAHEDIEFVRSADLRHVGQGFEIPVPVPSGHLTKSVREVLRQSFHDCYEELFERRVEDVPIESMNWRLAARAPAPLLSGAYTDEAKAGRSAHKGTRTITLPEFGTVAADIYDRYSLSSGFEFSGPAVVEERESTTIVGPDARVVVDQHKNLIISIHN